MSCKELYDRLTRENKREQSLVFGKEFEGRDPSNLVFQEFEDYLATTDRLEELLIYWDNRCPEAMLSAILKGMQRNPKLKLRRMSLEKDPRPLAAIETGDFCRLFYDIASFDSTVEELRFGHNRNRSRFWIEFKSMNLKKGAKSFAINPVVFRDDDHLYATLHLLLFKSLTEGKVDNILLDLSFTNLSGDKILILLQMIASKCCNHNLQTLKLVLRNISEDCTFLLNASHIRALTDIVQNATKLDRITIEASGMKSNDATIEASNQLDMALSNSSIKPKKRKFYAWCIEESPWERK